MEQFLEGGVDGGIGRAAGGHCAGVPRIGQAGQGVVPQQRLLLRPVRGMAEGAAAGGCGRIAGVAGGEAGEGDSSVVVSSSMSGRRGGRSERGA